ncbi:MAG: FGGY family carbohydrate kinase, partial [Chloroflexota bacterium]
MKTHILAHDLGTTGNKATLYNDQGQLVSASFSGYETEYAHPGWAEQNPEDWWQAVCQSTQALIKQAGIQSAEIACVTFSGQMMGCVPVDANAKPLRSAIIWADTRATEQADQVGKMVAFDRMYKITGHRLSSSYSLAKIMWIRDHQPGIYKATHKFLHAKDAMIARLTGRFATEPSDASGMNLYDLNTGEWSAEIIEGAKINGDQLPEILPSTGIAGEVTDQAATETGLAAG